MFQSSAWTLHANLQLFWNKMHIWFWIGKELHIPQVFEFCYSILYCKLLEYALKFALMKICFFSIQATYLLTKSLLTVNFYQHTRFDSLGPKRAGHTLLFINWDKSNDFRLPFEKWLCYYLDDKNCTSKKIGSDLDLLPNDLPKFKTVSYYWKWGFTFCYIIE